MRQTRAGHASVKIEGLCASHKYHNIGQIKPTKLNTILLNTHKTDRPNKKDTQKITTKNHYNK